VASLKSTIVKMATTTTTVTPEPYTPHETTTGSVTVEQVPVEQATLVSHPLSSEVWPPVVKQENFTATSTGVCTQLRGEATLVCPPLATWLHQLGYRAPVETRKTVDCDLRGEAVMIQPPQEVMIQPPLAAWLLVETMKMVVYNLSSQVAVDMCARNAHDPTECGGGARALEEECGSQVAASTCARSAHDSTECGGGARALEEEGDSQLVVATCARNAHIPAERGSSARVHHLPEKEVASYKEQRGFHSPVARVGLRCGAAAMYVRRAYATRRRRARWRAAIRQETGASSRTPLA
jgi:hypothetical protein